MLSFNAVHHGPQCFQAPFWGIRNSFHIFVIWSRFKSSQQNSYCLNWILQQMTRNVTQSETEMRSVCPQQSTCPKDIRTAEQLTQYIYGVGTGTGLPALQEHANTRPNNSGRARPSEGLSTGTIKKQPSIRDPPPVSCLGRSPRAEHRSEHRNPSANHHNAALQTFVVPSASCLNVL